MTRRLALLGALLSAALPATAHHGWSSFDRDRVLDLTAPVIRSTYANPHGMLWIGRGGQELAIELAPTSRMQARGLAPEDIAPGKLVRVHAYESTVERNVFRAEWVEVAGRRVELR